MRVLLLGLLFVAQTSYAVVDLQLGFRWSSYEGLKNEIEDFTSIDMVVGAHIAPLPMVPLSLGLVMGLGGYENDALDSDKSHGSMDVAAMVRAWLPMTPVVTPYGWLRYTLWGNWEYGSGKDRQSGDLGGYQGGIGAKHEFFPLLHVFLELGYGISDFAQSKKKLEKFLGKKDEVDLKTVAIAFGVGVGL